MPLSEILQRLTGEWSTDVLPTATTLTHINPTNVVGVIDTLLSASSAYPTITRNIDLYLLARVVKGAKASLSVISAQNYIATATATQDFPLMTQVIWNSTMELQELEMGFNLYQMKLSSWPNLTFALIFAILVLCHISVAALKRTAYFGACLICGTFLETAGYTARLLSINHYSDKQRYLCQTISLTLAPAFIMAGVYYLLAQLMVIHGRKFTILRPLWYSYIFIVCDVCSLFIQAAGGGLAAIRLQVLENTKPGTIIMTIGVAFQVFSMTFFLFFLFNFLWRIYFTASPEVKFLIGNLGALFFQTKRGKEIQTKYLNSSYNQNYRHTIDRPLFGYYPLAIFLACFFIYVRCVYRLVELSEGWSGYLITHEEFVMTLDGLQVLITCVILLFFHPGFIFGKNFKISLSEKESDDDFLEEKLDYPYISNDEKLRDSSLEWSSYDVRTSNTSFRQSVAGQQNRNEKSETQQPFNVIPYNTSPKQATYADSWLKRTEGTLQMENDQFTSAPDRLPFEDPSEFPKPKEPLNLDHNPFKTKGEYLNPVIEDEIMAVPYDYCSPNPPVIPATPKKKSKRNSKSRKSDLVSITSVNPYEREGVDVLKTSGPYELYDQPELANHIHIDNSDVESRFTHDEFFFTFGAKS